MVAVKIKGALEGVQRGPLDCSSIFSIYLGEAVEEHAGRVKPCRLPMLDVLLQLRIWEE